ncbi:MAG: hypothetical protein U0T82_04435 [Bacteroidales bacterium]
MRKRFLSYFLMISIFSLFLSLSSYSQVDPEDPPDDGGGTELGVPLSGTDIFYVIALGLGGLLIYGQHRKSKLAEKTSADIEK